MTVYNWRRKGINPRLLAWRWAVSSVDMRWYISEFVWNSWENVRRKGSDRLPVISRIGLEKYPPKKRRGFLFIGRFVPNKGIRILIEAYYRISPNPDTWPLTLVGDGPLKEEILKLVSDKGKRGGQSNWVCERIRKTSINERSKMDGHSTPYQ